MNQNDNWNMKITRANNLDDCCCNCNGDCCPQFCCPTLVPGPTGPTGPIGPAGAIGPTGPTGAAGPVGVAGAAGPMGPTGADGNTPVITVGNTITGKPGGVAQVVETFTLTGANLQFTIPAGPTGPAGTAGANGATGPAGAMGPTGPAGAAGAAGPTGPTGATGKTGPAGADGAIGPSGPAGPLVTSDSMSALNTTGVAINVELCGTDIPLPDNQILGAFSADAANQVFTAKEAGTYVIMYRISLTSAFSLASRILLNETPLPGSIISPLSAVSSFEASFMAKLAAGDTLQLQLYNFTGAAALQGENGASLIVIRLS